MRSPKVPWTLTILTENNHWVPVYSAPGLQMPLRQLRQLPESTHSQFQNISNVNLCETTENTCIQKYRKYYPTHPSQSSKMMDPNLELANKVLQNKNCSCTFAAAASMILRSSSRSSQTWNNAQTRRAVRLKPASTCQSAWKSFSSTGCCFPSACQRARSGSELKLMNGSISGPASFAKLPREAHLHPCESRKPIGHGDNNCWRCQSLKISHRRCNKH